MLRRNGKLVVDVIHRHGQRERRLGSDEKLFVPRVLLITVDACGRPERRPWLVVRVVDEGQVHTLGICQCRERWKLVGEENRHPRSKDSGHGTGSRRNNLDFELDNSDELQQIHLVLYHLVRVLLHLCYLHQLPVRASIVNAQTLMLAWTLPAGRPAPSAWSLPAQQATPLCPSSEAACQPPQDGVSALGRRDPG